MMNLRAIANSAVQGINPNITATWIQSTGGYVTAADGTRTVITASRAIQVQVQPLSSGDLAHTDGLNLQGVLRSAHLYGQAAGVVRADQKGGDILQFPESVGGPLRNWRVVTQMEAWPTWARVIVQMQNVQTT